MAINNKKTTTKPAPRALDDFIGGAPDAGAGKAAARCGRSTPSSRAAIRK